MDKFLYQYVLPTVVAFSLWVKQLQAQLVNTLQPKDTLTLYNKTKNSNRYMEKPDYKDEKIDIKYEDEDRWLTWWYIRTRYFRTLQTLYNFLNGFEYTWQLAPYQVSKESFVFANPEVYKKNVVYIEFDFRAYNDWDTKQSWKCLLWVNSEWVVQVLKHTDQWLTETSDETILQCAEKAYNKLPWEQKEKIDERLRYMTWLISVQKKGLAPWEYTKVSGTWRTQLAPVEPAWELSEPDKEKLMSDNAISWESSEWVQVESVEPQLLETYEPQEIPYHPNYGLTRWSLYCLTHTTQEVVYQFFGRIDWEIEKITFGIDSGGNITFYTNIWVIGIDDRSSIAWLKITDQNEVDEKSNKLGTLKELWMNPKVPWPSKSSTASWWEK